MGQEAMKECVYCHNFTSNLDGECSDCKKRLRDSRNGAARKRGRTVNLVERDFAYERYRMQVLKDLRAIRDNGAMDG